MGDAAIILHVSGSAQVAVTKTHVVAENATCAMEDGRLKIHAGRVRVVDDVVHIEGACSAIVLNGAGVPTIGSSVRFPIADGHAVCAVHTEDTAQVSLSGDSPVAPAVRVHAEGDSCVDLGSNPIENLHVEALGMAVVRGATASSAEICASGMARVYRVHAGARLICKALEQSVILASSAPGCAIFKRKADAAVLEINTKFT
jgi:hypothetical protein